MDKDFADYVKKYCATYGYTESEALDHKLVQLVKKFYEEGKKK